MRVRISSLLSAAGFIAAAMVISAAYYICDRLGWREYTSILSGTPPLGQTWSESAIFRGGTYACLYFAHVLVSPILLIAGLLLGVVRSRRFLTG